MIQARICPECSTPLPSGVANWMCPVCLLSQAAGTEAQMPALPSPSLNPPSPSLHFGDYELLEEIARGGMGVVYRARQLSLNRIVAVKMILFSRFGGEVAAQRFRAEAQSAARLQHPGIVAVHEVGEHEGQPYYSMDYVEGRNLAEVIFDLRTSSPDWKRIADWMHTIAEAVHYAHTQGILHRDLKPSNILLGVDGQPRVADFGLAKRLETSAGPDSQSQIQSPKSNSDLTLSGQALGSPNYMPPEQASAKRGTVGPTSDVYSLGAILFHLLTGRPPFVAETVTETLSEVLTAEAPSPRLVNPAVPLDLATLCLKCLEKEPAKRYQTAQELADELGRFIRGDSINARPIDRTERAWRWCKRKPALAGSFAAIMTLAAIVLVGSPIAFYRIDQQRTRAVASALEARKNLYAADMSLASQALDAGNLARAIELLEKYQPTNASRSASNPQLSPDLRAWEWRYLWSQTRSDELFTLGRHTYSEPGGLAFEPRNGTLVSGDMQGVLKFWDFASRRLIEEVSFPDELTRLALSPDGRWLASGGLNGFIRLWDMAGRKPMATISNRQYVGQLVFSPDGKHLAAREAERLSLWEVGSWKSVAEWNEIGTPVPSDPEGMAFTPDGHSLAYSKRDGTIVFWSLKDHSESGTLPGNEAYVSSIAFSPDGRLLLAGDLRGVAHVWNVPERRRLVQLGRPKEFIAGSYQIAFSPDGAMCAVLVAQTIVLYDTATWRELITFRGHHNAIYNVLFTGDSSRLATFSKDGTIKVWDTKQRRPIRFLSASSTNKFDLSEDGAILERHIVTNAAPVRVFSLLNPPSLTTRSRVGSFPPQRALSFPRAAGPMALLSNDGLIQVIHPTNSRVLAQFNSPGRSWIQLSPDGRILVAGPSEPHLPLEVWDVSGSNLLGKFQLSGGEIRSTEFTADSSRFVVCFFYGTNSGMAEVWDIVGLRRLAVFGTLSSPLGQLCFTRDGKRAIGVRLNGTATIWDAASSRELATVAGELDPYFCLALSPDGTRLALGGGTGIIGLFDLTAMPPQPLATFPVNDGLLNQLAFTPDGHTLVANSENGVRIWHAPPLTETDVGKGTK